MWSRLFKIDHQANITTGRMILIFSHGHTSDAPYKTLSLLTVCLLEFLSSVWPDSHLRWKTHIKLASSWLLVEKEVLYIFATSAPLFWLLVVSKDQRMYCKMTTDYYLRGGKVDSRRNISKDLFIKKPRPYSEYTYLEVNHFSSRLSLVQSSTFTF